MSLFVLCVQSEFNDNNNSDDVDDYVYGAIIVACHFKSSPGSYDEHGMAPNNPGCNYGLQRWRLYCCWLPWRWSGHCAQPVCAVCGWCLTGLVVQFSDDSALEVCNTRYALYKSTFLPFFSACRLPEATPTITLYKSQVYLEECRVSLCSDSMALSIDVTLILTSLKALSFCSAVMLDQMQTTYHSA